MDTQSNSLATSHKTITDTEVLRGIAILFVLYFRLVFLWQNSLIDKLRQFTETWTGVDLFFAISGFVIARGLLQIGNGQYDSAIAAPTDLISFNFQTETTSLFKLNF
jgi:peptidoglycan/LPS O-acetylase OafA/YrhL